MVSFDSPSDPNIDQGPAIVAACTVCCISALISVILRIWARKMKGISLGLDDWLVVAALPITITSGIVTSVATNYGLGRHLQFVEPPKLLKFGLLLFCGQILWAAAIPIIKLSILILYIRIFGSIRYFRWCSYIIGTLSICWAICVIIVLCLQCRPIKAFWNPQIPHKCINYQAFYVAGSAPNVALYWIVLLLPLPAVWDLQMNFTQKLRISGIFMLGSGVCIISVVRLVDLITKTSPDMTYSQSRIGIWTVAEINLGIVCACLPALRPLLKRCTRHINDTLVAKGSDSSFTWPYFSTITNFRLGGKSNTARFNGKPYSSRPHSGTGRRGGPGEGPWQKLRRPFGSSAETDSLQGLYAGGNEGVTFRTKISKGGPDGEGGFLEHTAMPGTTEREDVAADVGAIELNEQGGRGEGRGNIYAVTTIDVETERID